MGGLLSKAKLTIYAYIKIGVVYDILKKRLNTPPGLPVQNPTLPLWTIPTAELPLDPSGTLPEYADVVIIGSGITGTSIAYNLYALAGDLKVVMLDARDVCSGATGRNGGHINPPLHHDYNELKKLHGEQAAKAMIAFRCSHFTEMSRIVKEEDISKQSQIRETEHLDVYITSEAFVEAKVNLEKWRTEMPVESSSFVSYEGPEAIGRFHLADNVVGCMSNTGGAMHPYRFVMSLLSVIRTRHGDNFRIFSHTPCTSIASAEDGYIVYTPAGAVRTTHVVHATNGWCSELLRPLLAKVAPARGGMSAQRPGAALHASTLSGSRSFVFYRGATGYDYLTQLPTGEHELMFGGGWAMANDETHGLPEIGIADDSVVNHVGQSYLAGALPQFFGMKNWGREVEAREDGDGVTWGTGRTKSQWSGILGISADQLPWVGRLPAKVSGRSVPKRRPAAWNEKAEPKEGKTSAHTAAPGEWLSAGYSGEGMVHAWMSGKALAYMVLDRDDETREWFPDILRITEKRWKEASMEKLFEKYM